MQTTGPDQERVAEPTHGDVLSADAGLAEPRRLGFAALLWPARKQREWCCESCRMAAESQPATW